jgi:hypothetical protein
MNIPADFKVPKGFSSCHIHAREAYVRRYITDTNPMIAQAVAPSGREQYHWYYRSDDAIATSFWFWGEGDRNELDFMGFYEGPIEGLPEGMGKHFGEGRYVKDDYETGRAKAYCRVLQEMKGTDMEHG